MTYFSPTRLAAADIAVTPAGSATSEPMPAACFAAGSRRIAPELRPSIAAYYRFAAYARRMADRSAHAPDDGRRHLGQLDAVLSGQATPDASDPGHALAAAVRADFMSRHLPLEHARHLLQAYAADIADRPCRSWSDLLAYCRYAAAPMGRFVLDLHGEDRAAWPAAEALCAAMTIVAQVRDGRAARPHHLPQDWVAEAGGALPPVLTRLLDGVDRLHEAAAPLPRQIRARGLRMEAARSLALSQRLAKRLRRRGPKAGDVELSRLDRIYATFAALRFAWRR